MPIFVAVGESPDLSPPVEDENRLVRQELPLRRKLILVGAILALTSCKSGDAPKSAVDDSHWVAAPKTVEVNLLGVDLADAKNGWAVGDIAVTNGAVLRTSDGGLSWQPVSTTNEILSAVDFVNLTHGWAVGYAGRIQRTDDGGATWKILRAERQNEVLNSIFFLDNARGWAVGGSGLLLTTENGGDTWDEVSTGREEDFWSVRFLSADRGFIVGEDGLIMFTGNGGREWTRQASGTARALMGVAAGSGYAVAVGEGGLILRTEDFSTWRVVDSGTGEDLNAVESSDEHCWAVGSRGITVGSRDRGISWKVAPAAVQSDLMALSISGPASAVAVGRGGAIQCLSPK